MPENKKNLMEKILEIRRAMPYFQKDTQGYGYKYVSGCAVLETFRKIADELKVLLILNVIKGTLTQVDKNRAIELDIEFKFINVEDQKETLSVPFKAYGEQTDSSKAFGSALTYAERYFLLKFFNVPTDVDDPDAKGINQEPEGKNEGPKTKTYTAQKQDKLTIDHLSTSHFINEKERTRWNNSKNDEASRSKGVDYIMEKVSLGKDIEFKFYSKFMTDKKLNLTKKEAEERARAKILNEFTPLTIDQIKEQFKEILK